MCLNVRECAWKHICLLNAQQQQEHHTFNHIYSHLSTFIPIFPHSPWMCFCVFAAAHSRRHSLPRMSSQTQNTFTFSKCANVQMCTFDDKTHFNTFSTFDVFTHRRDDPHRSPAAQVRSGAPGRLASSAALHPHPIRSPATGQARGRRQTAPNCVQMW